MIDDMVMMVMMLHLVAYDHYSHMMHKNQYWRTSYTSTYQSYRYEARQPRTKLALAFWINQRCVWLKEYE
jgi:hypothetical protein